MNVKLILMVISIHLTSFSMVGNATPRKDNLLQTINLAKQGDSEARFQLGKHYSSGRGARYDEAAKWLKLAAEQGHVDAQIHLSSLYYKGKGVPQDWIEAYAWSVRADMNGNSMAREQLAERLTPEQITAGTRRARHVQQSSDSDSAGNEWLANQPRLSRSADHLWEGDHSYRWSTGKPLELSAPGRAVHPTKGSFEMRLYNTKAYRNGELLVEFITDGGKVCKSFTYRLNFQAWRPVICKYGIMTNHGGKSFSRIRLSTHGLPKGHQLYLSHLDPASPAASWDSGASFQMPDSPYMADKYFNSYRALMQLKPIASVNRQDGQDLQLIRKRLQESIRADLPENPKAPWKPFEAFEIHTDAHGIQGKSLNGKFGKYMQMIYGFAVYYTATNDPKAAEAVELGLRHFLDRGYGAGTHAHIGLAGYAFGDTLPQILILMDGVIDPALLQECWKAAAWHLNIGYILTENPPHNTDWIGTKSQNGLYYALFRYADPNMQRALLQAWHDYMNDYMQYRFGKEDHLKPDGSIYHHGNHYIGYGHTSMWRMILNFHHLRGTCFRMSSFCYSRFCAVLHQQTCNLIDARCFPWTMNGRNGLPINFKRVSPDEFKKLAEIGGDLQGRPFDPAIAAMANRIFPQESLFAVPPETPPNGFWQMNYANAGFFRREKWLAFTRGFTDTHWGMEAGPNANRYAFFQGHGSLEILYPGSPEANGYPKTGWDYNLFPGTTALRMAPEELSVLTDTKGGALSAVKQRNSFCGTVAFGQITPGYFDSHGQYGLFGFDFESKHHPGFRYRKSHFFLNDRYIVCLLSGLGSNDPAHPVTTTLFQRVEPEGKTTEFMLNGISVPESTEKLAVAQAHWLIDPLGTGYWVRNARIRYARKTQTYPSSTTRNVPKKKDRKAAWAYIDYGTSPENSASEHVVVPATTPEAMLPLAHSFSTGSAYEILQHNNTCHAIRDNETKLTGMAIYALNAKLPDTIIEKIDHPCLLVFKAENNTLQLSLSNPNLAQTGFKNKDDHQIVTIMLKGNWTLHTELPALVALRNGGPRTELKIKTQYGQRTQLELVRK